MVRADLQIHASKHRTACDAAERLLASPIMRTLAEVEATIETLPLSEVEKLAILLERRRLKEPAWPVPPPSVDPAELDRNKAEIEEEFPTLRG